MSAVLTRDQAEVLRAKSRGWAMARLIAHTDRAIQDEKQGMHGGTGGAWWFDTDAVGVHGTRAEDLHRITYGKRGREHLVHVTWTELRRAVKALPVHLVDDVAAAYRVWRVHYERHMVRPYNPANVAMVPWVGEDPKLRGDAEARMRDAVDAALDALSDAGPAGPSIRTHIGPRPPHQPKSVDTWIWSRCWTCGWYAAHLEERQAMQHSIEVAEHRCTQAVQLDLFEVAG